MPELATQLVIQYLFCGTCVVLLGILVWRWKREDETYDQTQQTLMALHRKTIQVIIDNSTAVKALSKQTDDLLVISRANERRLISRPCISVEET